MPTNRTARADPPSPAGPAGGAVTRLAPSPTGALHLGNARTFLVNWALARAGGWRIVLRIEDLDGPRIKPGAAQALEDTLRWLGIDWDEGPLIQSADLAPYVQALRTLAERGAAYPCELSRAQIEAAASAPQQGTGEVHFPASLRPAGFVPGQPVPWPEDATTTGWRFATPPGEVVIDDVFAGRQVITPAETIGDLAIWTKRGTPSYQLAVVVDDARQGVTHVVRGNDLLDSAARQRLLSRALGLTPEPRYLHLPLVLGGDGKRLAKRHGDSRVETYRAAGVKPERLIALIARWCGLGSPQALTAREFADTLCLDRIPRGPVVFTPEDDQWLRSRE